MKTHMKAIRFLAVAALVLCSVTALKAQTITGSVNGTVTDPSGAVIPNAKVTAINVDTGVTTETTSNGEGIYNRLVSKWRAGARQATAVAPIPYANRIEGDPSLSFRG